MRICGRRVELLETRHVRDAFKAMPVKTDRNDACDIGNCLYGGFSVNEFLLRCGWLFGTQS